jgi:hypothetical protein
MIPDLPIGMCSRCNRILFEEEIEVEPQPPHRTMCKKHKIPLTKFGFSM